MHTPVIPPSLNEPTTSNRSSRSKDQLGIKDQPNDRLHPVQA
ncbi:hypothetical protein SynPROS91_01305 [Synechococcus sp. PROS-9-1]|nr:hypothetical protein SynPROS91_01305 [Synechococcus sp. PROS-9-1]